MPTFVKTFKPHTIMTDKDKIELIIKEKGLLDLLRMGRKQKV